ncbi:MAG: non-canonical purine NTP diphosphatase [Cytophagales bacterium]|jgi:XTP/dITP diphosphohydrolase|nr:non-canonical purine NTP diphosphatase [Cytophagales bacterium]
MQQELPLRGLGGHRLCFATNNRHKIEEIAQLVEASFEIVSLADIGCHDELPENQDTLEGNAFEKAEYVWTKFGVSCFADDTGLEVMALDGDPGVYTARYAGPQRNADDNMNLLLQNLSGKSDRTARFRTCIALILNGERHLFEGVVKGRIAHERHGAGGFGYDPVFVPEGHIRTFAEMTLEEKGAISHRGEAVRKLVAFLRG